MKFAHFVKCLFLNMDIASQYVVPKMINLTKNANKNIKTVMSQNRASLIEILYKIGLE